MTDRDIEHEIRTERGFEALPSFYRVMRPYPKLLARYWDFLRAALGPGDIDAKTKEMIALAVSITTGRHYAIDSHLHIARQLGMSESEFEEILLICAAFAQTAVVCDALKPNFDPAEYGPNSADAA